MSTIVTLEVTVTVPSDYEPGWRSIEEEVALQVAKVVDTNTDWSAYADVISSEQTEDEY